MMLLLFLYLYELTNNNDLVNSIIKHKIKLIYTRKKEK